MKPNLLKLLFCVGTLATAGLTGLGLAAPLQRADVAADPAWLAHLDCDGLRPTPIGQFLLSEMDKPDAQAKLAAFQAIFSFDLRTQLHGLTLYSTGDNPKDGVLLIYADFDAERLLTLAKAAKDSQSTTYKQHVIYNWIDEKKKARNGVRPRVYAAIQGKRLVMSQTEARVAAALDVLDGATPNLSASKAFPQLGAAGDTSFLEGAARKLDLAAEDPNAALFRLSRLARLQVSGNSQQVSAVLTLEANDEETAGQMVTVAQGLVALMKLQKEKPEAAKLGSAITLKQDGPSIVAKATLPANDLIEMMKADAARKAARKAQEKEQVK
jgi:hypothetical protein